MGSKLEKTMQVVELKLNLLKASGTVKTYAFDVSKRFVSKVSPYLTDDNAERFDTLITHLAMALQRLDERSEISEIDVSITAQLKTNEKYEAANAFINRNLYPLMGKKFNEAEEAFITMHVLGIFV